MPKSLIKIPKKVAEPAKGKSCWLILFNLKTDEKIMSIIPTTDFHEDKI